MNRLGKIQRIARATVLKPYEDRLLQWLEADARRAKRDRRTALALLGHLQILGFSGSYSRVSEYVPPGTGGRTVRRLLRAPLFRSSLRWAKRSSLIGAKSRC